MSIQGQVVRVASALERQALPPEIAFLSRHGVEAGILRQAAEIATAVGVTADEAALKGDLLDEPAFYRALAAELGLPFLAEVEVDESARYPESIVAGLVPIARAFGAHRYAMAPTAEAVVRLLTSARGYGPGLAITTPSALRQGVLRGRPRSIAWHAANDLPETRPEWSFREGGSWAQIAWAAAVSGFLALFANLAPSSTLMAIMALSGVIFLGMVTLRMAAAREPIPIAPTRPSIRYDDRDLPVYTLIICTVSGGCWPASSRP